MINQKKLGEKIKELRENLEISQDDLAKKVGLSRAAVSEIERGNRGIEALELAKIAEIFKMDMDYLLREEGPIDVKKSFIKKDIEFEFNRDKLKNVILYVLGKCGGKPNVGETVLYKLLYFIDFDNFEINGSPVTAMTYIRRQFGPVPAAKQYNPVIISMLANGELKIFSQQYYGMPQKRYVALKNYEADSLTAKEVEVMDKVINRLSDMSARQIEEYVHNDIPYQSAPDKQIISYNLVFERTSPYAHNDYGKLWHDAAIADTLKELGPMSDKECNYYKNL